MCRRRRQRLKKGRKDPNEVIYDVVAPQRCPARSASMEDNFYQLGAMSFAS